MLLPAALGRKKEEVPGSGRNPYTTRTWCAGQAQEDQAPEVPKKKVSLDRVLVNQVQKADRQTGAWKQTGRQVTSRTAACGMYAAKTAVVSDKPSLWICGCGNKWLGPVSDGSIPVYPTGEPEADGSAMPGTFECVTPELLAKNAKVQISEPELFTDGAAVCRGLGAEIV